MATNIAEIGFIADSSQLRTAKTALDQLTPSARATDQATQHLTQSLQAAASSAGAVTAGASRITTAIQSQEAATVRAVHANGIYVDSAGRVRAAGQAFVVTSNNVVSASQMQQAAIGGSANALDNAVQSYARATTAAGHYINAAGRVVNAQGRFVTAAQAAADRAELAAAAQAAQAQAATAAAAAQERLNNTVQQGGKDVNIMNLNTANLAAQFQDIGVTAAMGMNPLMIALQQGTQISAVLSANGASAAKAVEMLKAAFMSVISPVALGTIAIIALGVALIQMVPWAKATEATLRGMASALRYLREALVFTVQLVAAFGVAWAVVNFSTVISGVAMLTRSVWSLVSAIYAAMAPLIGIPAIIALAVVALIYFRNQVAGILGPNLIAIIKAPFNFLIGAAVGTSNAITEIIRTIPTAFKVMANGFVSDWKGFLNTILEAASDVVKQLPWWLGGSDQGISFRFDPGNALFQVEKQAWDLGERVKGSFTKALDTDWIGEIGKMAGYAIDGAAKQLDKWANSLAKAEPKYQKLVRAAEKQIALLKVEQQGIGQNALQYNILREQIELLAKAKEDNIKLTPEMEKHLRSLGATIGTLKTETEALQAAFNFSRDIVGGFVRDLRDGLKNGESFLKSFANAAVNVLNKVSDRLIDLSLDFLFTSQKGGAASGPLGGLVKMFGGMFPSAGSINDASWLAGLSILPNAKGNVFGSGGIIDQPTVFAFAKGGALGIAGEAGTEAVMPLARGPDGSLGVQVHGRAGNDNGGPSVLVQVINNAQNTEVREERSMNGDGTEVRRIIIDTVKQGTAEGEFDMPQRARFGNTLNRVVR